MNVGSLFVVSHKAFLTLSENYEKGAYQDLALEKSIMVRFLGWTWKNNFEYEMSNQTYVDEKLFDWTQIQANQVGPEKIIHKVRLGMVQPLSPSHRYRKPFAVLPEHVENAYSTPDSSTLPTVYNQYYERIKNRTKVSFMLQECTPFAGLNIGYSSRYEGYIHSGGYGDDYYEPNYFVVRNTIPVQKVQPLNEHNFYRLPYDVPLQIV